LLQVSGSNKLEYLEEWMLSTFEASISEELARSSKRRGCGISKQHQQRLANDLSHLAAGLRPALLFDHGALAANRLQLVLDVLKQKIPSVVHLELLPVSEDDFIVVNFPLLLAKMKADLANGLSHVMFVDVSPGMNKPKECSAEFKSAVLKQFEQYHERLSCTSAPLESSSIPEEVALPTLVGWLLGYPVLYCWEPPADMSGQLFAHAATGNCLGMQPLLVSCLEVYR
jgi:hypothetical protein